MRAFFTGLAILVFATDLKAEIPTYNAEKYCTEVSEFSGTFSYQLYDSSLGIEQSSYNNLKRRWVDIEVSIRQHCDEVATFGGTGSYSLLESCVQLEERAKAKSNTFKY